MTELCKLAAKYGTDKIHYTPFYSLLLEHRRESTHRVLEIGIGTPEAMKHVADYKPGASLRMWEKYFPNALIYGIDKDPRALFSTNRIRSFLGDQSRVCSYIDYALYGPFDLIVDDGSHEAEHQLKTLDALLPHLNKGGLYIIEDVNGILDVPIPHSYVQVKGTLTGRCVVING